MKKKIAIISVCLIILCAFTVYLIKPTIKSINYGLDFKGGFEVLYKVESLGKELKPEDLKSTYKSIINRIDTLGVSEPEIIIEGNNIRVKLPGVKDENEARERLSTPAVLSFRNSSDEELMNANVLASPGAKLDYDPKTSKPVVALSIKDNDKFYRVTKNISESTDKLIVIWLDYTEGDSFESQKEICGQDGNFKCISAASVNEGFMNNVVIQGNFTEKEAQKLVDLINSGSLPTKLTEISTKVVDATLGNETIKTVLDAFIISLILISLLLTFKYRFSGLITSICLIIYTILVIIIFNNIGGTLTLPGIAAMILGIGMAVDSNIISIERIKDEVKNKNTIKTAFKEGNKRSITAIIDANITTLLVAIILFIFGESAVKGFATMFVITIFATIFIMVYLNRYILKLYIDTELFNGKEKFFFGKNTEYKNFDFIKNAKYFAGISLTVLLMGFIFLGFKGLNLGIDFKGGSIINLKGDLINIEETNKYFDKYNVREANKINDNEVTYNIKESLEKNEVLEIQEKFNDYKVEINSISNLVKKDLTKNAMISLLLASIGILIYIAIRFNWSFSISSIITLMHDIIMVVMVFAIIRMEIDFIFIAAILTILGYSVNDTIVLFDRIRENRQIIYKNNIKSDKILKELVNKSSNETISRNILTSSTTFITLLILLYFNIKEILPFNVALLIGLIAGSISTLFLAPYIYYYFEKRELKNNGKKKTYDDEIDELSVKGINS